LRAPKSKQCAKHSFDGAPVSVIEVVAMPVGASTRDAGYLRRKRSRNRTSLGIVVGRSSRAS
jgi:hypothetical protein